MDSLKIIQVVNAMILNKNRITNVTVNKAGDEIFFLYNKKYKWSIIKKAEKYNVIYYPESAPNIEVLATIDDWATYSDYVVYRTEDLKTKEAIETFSDLYGIVQSKLYNLDEAFEDILKDLPKDV